MDLFFLELWAKIKKTSVQGFGHFRINFIIDVVDVKFTNSVTRWILLFQYLAI